MIKGIDLSHYDDVEDWWKIKESGVEFAFLKATEGMTLRDPMFAQFSAACATHGIKHGAYHFFRPQFDPVLQAKFFLNTVGVEAGELPMVMDWETGLPTGNRSMDVESALEFLQYVHQATGKVPIVYGSPAFLRIHELDSRFKTYPLWVAEYEVPQPKIPPPWDHYLYWQWSESGSVQGIKGACDLNWFNGPSL